MPARRVLILGGTAEASALARAVADLPTVAATFSYAGRVERPIPQPIPTRVGGFGGVAGLVRYLAETGTTHVIDATHPFAAQMSRHAVAACAETGVSLIALTRPPWQAQAGDDWIRVPDIDGAVAALAGPARRVLLALGRINLPAFAAQSQHHYLLRLVDPPEVPPPLPDHAIVVSRGPFTIEGDLALLRQRRIDLVVSKNAGGTAAVAKIEAARVLGLPVIVIDRPPLPQRAEAFSVDDVLVWLDHGAAERGV